MLQPGPVRRARARPAHLPGARGRLGAEPDPTPATWTWTYEPAEPGARDHDRPPGPPNPSTSITAGLQFSATGPEIEFECALDAEPFESLRVAVPDRGAACPASTSSRARDRHLRERRPEPARLHVACHRAAARADDRVGAARPERRAPSHTFTFSSTEPNATFECRITPNPFHEQHVRAVHARRTPTRTCPTASTSSRSARSTSSASPARSRPSGASRSQPARHDDPRRPERHDRDSTTAALRVHLQRARLDLRVLARRRRAFVECLSPAMFPGHRARLPASSRRRRTRSGRRPIDINGNIDPTPASRTWTVVAGTAPGHDDQSPGPTTRRPSTTATSASSRPSESSTFECSLDGAASGRLHLAARSTPACASASHEFCGRRHRRRRQRRPDAGDLHAGRSPARHAAPETTLVHAPDAATQSTERRPSRSPPRTARRSSARSTAAPYVACTSPDGYTGLAVGPHTFAVRATDASGNIDGPGGATPGRSTARRRRRRSTTQPAALTSSGTARLRVRRQRRARRATLPVPLDAGALGRVRVPKTYANLPAGPHTFSVRAIDAAGNVDPSPASYSWTVDTRRAGDDHRPPGPAASTDQHERDVRVRVRARRRATSARSTAAAYAPCTSPAAYTGLADGDHTFSRARDRRGRQRRPDPGDARLDDRPAARHDDRRPARPTRPRARPRPSASRRTSRASASSARSTARGFSSCSSPAEFTDLAAGRRTSSASAPRTAPATSTRRRPATRGRSRRRPRRRSTRRAGDRAPDAQTESTSATFTFSAEPGRRDLRVRARRRRARAVHLAEDLHRPRARRARLRGPGHRRRRQRSTRRRRRSRLGDRRPDAAGRDDHERPAGRRRPTEHDRDVHVHGRRPPTAVLQCSLDGAVPRVCTSPKTYTEARARGRDGGSAGAHTFEVTRDQAPPARRRPTPVTWEWTIVDLTAPETTIDLRPAGRDPARHAAAVHLLEQRARRHVRVLARPESAFAGVRRRVRPTTPPSSTSRSPARTPCSCARSTRAATPTRRPSPTPGRSSARRRRRSRPDVPARPTRRARPRRSRSRWPPTRPASRTSCSLDGVAVARLQSSPRHAHRPGSRATTRFEVAGDQPLRPRRGDAGDLRRGRSPMPTPRPRRRSTPARPRRPLQHDARPSPSPAPTTGRRPTSLTFECSLDGAAFAALHLAATSSRTWLPGDAHLRASGRSTCSATSTSRTATAGRSRRRRAEHADRQQRHGRPRPGRRPERDGDVRQRQRPPARPRSDALASGAAAAGRLPVGRRAVLRHQHDGGLHRAGHGLPHLRARRRWPSRSACCTTTAAPGSTSRPQTTRAPARSAPRPTACRRSRS